MDMPQNHGNDDNGDGEYENGNEENENGNDVNGQEMNGVEVIRTICIGDDKKLVEGHFPACLFDVQSVNFFNKDLSWECVTAGWKRISGDEVGRVTFSFPLSLLGSSYDFESIHELI